MISIKTKLKEQAIDMYRKAIPFHLFEDASRGSREQKWAAYKKNKELAYLLIGAIRNWCVSLLLCFSALHVLDWLVIGQKLTFFVYIQGVVGVALAISFMVIAVMTVMYTYLRVVPDQY